MNNNEKDKALQEALQEALQNWFNKLDMNDLDTYHQEKFGHQFDPKEKEKEDDKDR